MYSDILYKKSVSSFGIPLGVFHVSLLCVDVFVFLILEQLASPTP